MTTNVQEATMTTVTPTESKNEEVLQTARAMFNQSPEWIMFFREVIGLGGTIRTAFPTPEQLTAFQQTTQYAEIQEMLAQLRQRGLNGQVDGETTRVITVRLPKSMHEFLRAEAHEQHTSMNKLCISKLLQMIDGSLVPTDAAGGK